MPVKPFVIAIDGPVAAGKGTIARRLAAHFNLSHLDTGALYRAVAVRLRRLGIEPGALDQVAEEARRIGPRELADPLLRDEKTGMIASRISAHQPVRDALLSYQRGFAAKPPDGTIGAVLEGRDTTTIVCPDAEVKFFITADPACRARRRYDELLARGEKVDYANIFADLEARDARDRNRPVAPLQQGADAHLLDTTNLDIDTAFDRAVEIVGNSWRFDPPE